MYPSFPSFVVISLLMVNSGLAQHDTTVGCYSRNTRIRIVTIQSPVAVVRLVSVREKYKCGLWNLAVCTRISKKYMIVYELRSKLATAIRYDCCPGFSGSECQETDCPSGYYGNLCSFPCGRCADSASCDRVNGFCPTGCAQGWGPRPSCSKVTPVPSTREPSTGAPSTRAPSTRLTSTTTTTLPARTTHPTFATASLVFPRTTTVRTTIQENTIIPSTREPSTPAPFTRVPSTTHPTFSTASPVFPNTTVRTTIPGNTIELATTRSISSMIPATTDRVTSTWTTADLCYKARPESRAITETVRLQAVPADIKMYCQITFPKDWLYRHTDTRWIYNDKTVFQINGTYTIEEWDYQQLTNGSQTVITSLVIFNASACDIGDYLCEGIRGQCTHRSRIHLDCPDISTDILQKHPAAGCCPEIKDIGSGIDEDSIALNIAVPVILGILLVLVIIVLPIIIYKRFGTIQILVKYYCGHFEDYDDKLYDVYVSFDAEDVQALRFVLGELRTFLSENGYSAFIFPLDSMPGSDKSDVITDAIQQSRRVMLIFGQSYRSCEWCRFEFITARRLFIKQRLRFIPITFGENLKDILHDKDFESLLKCIPSIAIPSTSEESISNKLANKLRLRLPRHAKSESNQIHSLNG